MSKKGSKIDEKTSKNGKVRVSEGGNFNVKRT